MLQHSAHIKNKTQEPLYEHFQSRKWSTINNLKIQRLKTLIPHQYKDNRSIERELVKPETLWIQRLMSGFPQGLNQIEKDTNFRYKSYTRTLSHNCS